MTNSLLLSAKTLCSYLGKNSPKLSKIASLTCTRNLYAKSTLGIIGFTSQCQTTRNQMGNIISKFKDKMSSYAGHDSTSMIFTEDLKNMVHLAESDQDIDLVVKMTKKFNSQNKELRFGSYIFGPVVMRLFHVANKPELALECFKSPELEGFFDQLISYQILLDLLYENGMYEDILDTSQSIIDRQIEGARYPRNIIVLALAACYKLNTEASYKFAVSLWKKLGEVGHLPMRRAATFCAGLALNQSQPSVAMEVISSVRNSNYTTVRNIKVAALADIGRVDDALPILKSVLHDDVITNIPNTFNRDVLEKVKRAVLKSDDADLIVEFERIEKIFEKQGHISTVTLDEQLCCEIQPPPIMNNRQVNRYSRYDQNSSDYRNYRKNFNDRGSNSKSRPGLRDLV